MALSRVEKCRCFIPHPRRLALNDEKEYPDKEDEGYTLLHELYVYLKKAHKETHGI